MTPETREIIELLAAAVAALSPDDKDTIKFTGAWKHLGEHTIASILDRADDTLVNEPSGSEAAKQ